MQASNVHFFFLITVQACRGYSYCFQLLRVKKDMDQMYINIQEMVILEYNRIYYTSILYITYSAGQDIPLRLGSPTFTEQQ